MEEDRIVLDRKSFEALAVDTRVRILKSLKARRKTLSEISKEQGMSVSGVKEHLETLEGVGLIVKRDDGHKWKYYELTKKGSEIVGPREIRVWILLSISAIALVASMVALLSPPMMMAEQANLPGAGSVDSDEPQLMAAAAYAGEADAGALPPEATARNLAMGNDTPAGAGAPEAKAAAAEGGSAAGAPDLAVPMAVGALSALTLAACVGILVRNRMRQPAA